MTSASAGVEASEDARTDAALTPAGRCLSETRLPHVKDAIGASATVASHEDHPRGHRQGRGIASRRREQHHGFSLPLLRNRGPVAHQIVLMRRDHPFLPSWQGPVTECDGRTRRTALSSDPKPGAMTATSMNDWGSPNTRRTLSSTDG